jgi:hypothetical protein
VTDQPDDNDDPIFCVPRPGVGDVFVRWSELTPSEQQNAWDHYNKMLAPRESRK